MDRKIVEHLKLGKSFNQISRELHVGKKRVRKLFFWAQEAGYLDGAKEIPPFPEALFPSEAALKVPGTSLVDQLLLEQLEWMKERRGVGWDLITIFEELPVQVNRSSFYRFIHRHGLGPGSIKARVIPEIVHQPGEALILDWGKLRMVADPKTGKKKTLWVFVGILGFSRYMMVRLVWSNSIKDTLAALESMFQELGGIPTRVTSDNPKCFALEASRYEPILNPAFNRFASHYGSVVELLPPRDPQKKGKVERMVPYVRRLYQAHGGDWHGLEESQAYLNRKVALANERIHGTTRLRPLDLLVEKELGCLKRPPALAYQKEEYASATVQKDGHVRFRNKYYSLEETHIGKEVFVIGTPDVVSIYSCGQLLETHSRVKSSHQSKSTKSLHLKPWERHLQDNKQYLERAAQLGPHVKALIEEILKQGNGFVDTRKVWGILSLDKKYQREAIDRACQKTLEWGDLGYQAVKRLLENRPPRNEEPGTIGKNKNHKFTRSPEEYLSQMKLIQ